MSEVTQQLDAAPGLWRRLTAAIRGRERASVSELDTSISFAELVWAHFERQKEVYADVLNGPWEQEYRRRLKLFKAEHGRIIEAYWCRYEASGVAVTEKRLPRRPTKFFRRDEILRLHTATDWRAGTAPMVAYWLHRWETAGIKAAEVLRETSERIALSWVFATSSRLLGFVDRAADASAIGESELDEVIQEQQAELDLVNEYYLRAGENSARIVYFRGMAWGAILLAAIVGGGFLGAWALGWVDPHEERTYTLFVTIAMGAVGAILSVMSRMARQDGFNLEFEVGRKSVRYLGGLRPWIGALFALALYLALKSSLLEIFQTSTPHGVYYFATIGFIAGFSERRAKVLLDSVSGDSGPNVASDENKPREDRNSGANRSGLPSRHRPMNV